MCGLAGIVGRAGVDSDRGEVVRRMTATLVHRGPDGEGYAARDGCDLGFRRLAIVDPGAVSPPFCNEDGSIWSACNGEIYNAAELRAELRSRGHRFRTNVDTEVIPHLFEEMGSELVHRLDGMFAFAVWDENRAELVLGRDRAGEKPLFYWQDAREFVFASEIRALLAHPRVPKAIDPVGLRRFLLHGFYPAPLSPLSGVRKLPAAHVLTLRDGRSTVERYWDLSDHFTGPPRSRRPTDRLIAELDRRIGLAVRRRSLSDVPVGVFLSGGIDSTTILAHATEQLGPGVPAFALGHADRSFDEARFARETARRFDADYNEIVVSESDLDEGLKRIGEGIDEPLADASLIPTHLLALFARGKVKVVFSGEGGDELFAGYPTYIGDRVAEFYRRAPGFVRRAVQAAARAATPVSMGNVGLDYLTAVFFGDAQRPRTERHHVWFGCIRPERHGEILSPEVVAGLRDDDPFGSARACVGGRRFPDSLAELLHTDFTMYLQDDLLTKVDRATMLASLEARAPFLDHELAEFVAGLPSRFKLNGWKTKVVLRRASRHRLPREVLTRRKRGFNIPFSRWLLHGLGERLQRRFSPERVRSRGVFSAEGIARMIREHMSRAADHRKPLFALLAFDLWCDRTYGEGTALNVGEAERVPAISRAEASR